MKMSEFIEKCQDALEEYGDLEVTLNHTELYIANDIEVARYGIIYNSDGEILNIKEVFKIVT